MSRPHPAWGQAVGLLMLFVAFLLQIGRLVFHAVRCRWSVEKRGSAPSAWEQRLTGEAIAYFGIVFVIGDLWLLFVPSPNRFSAAARVSFRISQIGMLVAGGGAALAGVYYRLHRKHDLVATSQIEPSPVHDDAGGHHVLISIGLLAFNAIFLMNGLMQVILWPPDAMHAMNFGWGGPMILMSAGMAVLVSPIALRHVLRHRQSMSRRIFLGIFSVGCFETGLAIVLLLGGVFLRLCEMGMN